MNIFLEHSPDRQQMQALTDCKLREDKIIGLFEKVLAETKDQLINADAERFQRLQGRAEALRDFLKALKEANEVMARLDKSRK